MGRFASKNRSGTGKMMQLGKETPSSFLAGTPPAYNLRSAHMARRTVDAVPPASGGNVQQQGTRRCIRLILPYSLAHSRCDGIELRKHRVTGIVCETHLLHTNNLSASRRIQGCTSCQSQIRRIVDSRRHVASKTAIGRCLLTQTLRGRLTAAQIAAFYCRLACLTSQSISCRVRIESNSNSTSRVKCQIIPNPYVDRHGFRRQSSN